ncbi:MAG: right-handed parallel beta-helix repeat-containing protein [Clostridia bacterium]|nr:right-handed parallel beta-helix repeat-containing protein [Clostridia bacterium]
MLAKKGKNTMNNANGSATAKKNAGAKWNVEKAGFDASSAKAISAAQLLADMAEGKLQAGEAYKVCEPVVLASGVDYRANGAVIFAERGLTVDGAESVALRDAIIVANGAAIKGCGKDLTVYACYLGGGVELCGEDVTVQGCIVEGSVTVKGESCIVRENTVSAGICVGAGSVNTLVALNKVKSVEICGCFNTSVVLNSACCISGKGNTNLYVVDNVAQSIDISDNNYLIANGNGYSEFKAENNENVNGDDVTDVDARVEYGANEELLPHTNKDLFVGMKRKKFITDPSLEEKKAFSAYMRTCAPMGKFVIIPPGAYAVEGEVYIDGAYNDTTIYAYGVYSECCYTDHKMYKGLFLYHIFKVHDFRVYGLTIGRALPSCGQVRIVDTFIEADGVRYESEADVPEGATPEYKLTAYSEAGFDDGFTQTNPEIFHTWWPETFLYDEKTGEHKMYPEENPDAFHKCVRNVDENGNSDGSMTITLLDKVAPTLSWKAKDIYDRIKPGTVMTCRFSNGRYHVYILYSTNILFRDVVLYGYAGGMANVAMGTDEVYFERFHDTPQGNSLIDRETYERYLAIQKKYGVDMEVFEDKAWDGTVRYRGPKGRSSSVDAFHITHTKTGYNVISSLLEGMVDDGSNQKGNSSRLHAIKDNGDGTTTIQYKPTMFSARWCAMRRPDAAPGLELSFVNCRNFAKGDIVFIYAPSGQVVCETPALTDFQPVGKYLNVFVDASKECDVYETTVATKDVNFDALYNPLTGIPYDISSNDVGWVDNGWTKYDDSQRITVDNLSWNACNYTMDNVMVHCGHTRGYLIKSADVTVKHCTFRNISYAGLLIKPEKSWAESSISRRLMITNNLFDNTGYMSNFVLHREFACITIVSTSKIANEKMLPMDDITVTHCKFTNNKQRNAIFVNSAKNVKITDNIFDENVIDIHPEEKGVAALLDTCANIELSGNTYNYAHYNGDIRNVVKGKNFVNVYGIDAVDENGNHLIPDNVD